jgi:hypothetical protein
VTPVRVHYDRCVDRYLASPGGRSQVTMAVLAAAYRPLKMGYGVPGPLP